MKLFSKKLVDICVELTWSSTWKCSHYTVLAHYEKRLFGFIKWGEFYQMAGPFNNKQEAKQCAKRLRKKLKFNPKANDRQF